MIEKAVTKLQTLKTQTCINTGMFWCISIAIITAPAQAQEFGTLFTTPEEREYLDYLRDEFVRRSEQTTFNINEDVIPEIPDEVVVEEAAPEVTQYSFGGIMVRRNGSRMVWLNGRQILEDDLPGNISITDGNANTQLRIRANNNNYLLKPGESININTGSPQNSTPQNDDANAGQTDTSPTVEESETAAIPEPNNAADTENLIVIDEEFMNVIDLENATPQQAALIQALIETRDSESNDAQP